MLYNVYAQDIVEASEGKIKRRYLGQCEGTNTGSGIFDLYADECGDQEEVVIEQAEESKAAATIGRKGGASKSPAKSKASAANGKLGGRPVRRVVPHGDQSFKRRFWEVVGDREVVQVTKRVLVPCDQARADKGLETGMTFADEVWYEIAGKRMPDTRIETVQRELSAP